MTDRNYAHVHLLVDRSGSMSAIKKETEDGVRSFVDGQRKVSDKRVTLSLSQFDHEYMPVWNRLPAHNVETFELQPRGETALLDAIGRAVTETGEMLASLSEEERPGFVTFVIVTDGLENASREWTRERVFDLIRQQTDQYGWTFVFLAANQDAIATGRTLGVPSAQSMTYDRSSTRIAYAAASNAIADSYVGTPVALPDDAAEAQPGGSATP